MVSIPECHMIIIPEWHMVSIYKYAQIIVWVVYTSYKINKSSWKKWKSILSHRNIQCSYNTRGKQRKIDQETNHQVLYKLILSAIM